jgi:hypothetical protein
MSGIPVAVRLIIEVHTVFTVQQMFIYFRHQVQGHMIIMHTEVIAMG